MRRGMRWGSSNILILLVFKWCLHAGINGSRTRNGQSSNRRAPTQQSSGACHGVRVRVGACGARDTRGGVQARAAVFAGETPTRRAQGGGGWHACEHAVHVACWAQSVTCVWHMCAYEMRLCVSGAT